ncbi:hypothetical protein REJC140_00150 [Pseudorhizobium endolithicum]|uniref:UPF0335 protein REJC140_00150 n=1 Tax=Pseudorhizobium endolithicum TaxID=1191678 RepID=A0ABN7JDA5_9HYPH|nr:hypothetical protein REJC140_00150 [Pseudorhizobium endolithicum]
MSDVHGVARDQLRAFIERIERLEEEKKTIADDIKDVYGEAKSMGFDPKILKKVVALRKKDDQERMEEEAVLATYLGALGMIPQFEMFEPEEVKPSREDRRRQRTTDAMDDHKALVDEMADAGLISEEARHENKALADAVSTQFGNGPSMALQSPRQAAEAVSERTAITDATVAPALVEADKAEAVAGGLGQPEVIPALTVQHHGVNVDGPERAGVTAGETATNSPIAPASQGEAEAPSAARVSLDEASCAAANTGGDHVESEPSAATHQAGALVELAPAIPGYLTYEDFPPVPMKRTSLAHCFPELSTKEYDALGTSVAFEGVLEPIVRRGNILLDGWSRYNIARNLGIQYPVIEYGGDDELLDVIRWQLAARNFTPAQSKKIAVELAKEVPHRASEIMAAFEIEEEFA